MPPLGECKSRIQYYKPEPCEAEIEACLSRPPLLPAPQFWVTLSVSGATWASFLPCERPLSFSARYHTQTSSLFFLSVRLRPLSPPQFLLLLYTNIPGPDWMRRHTHTQRRAGQKAGINRILSAGWDFAVLFIQRYIFAQQRQSLHYLITKWDVPQTSWDEEELI